MKKILFLVALVAIVSSVKCFSVSRLTPNLVTRPLRMTLSNSEAAPMQIGESKDLVVGGKGEVLNFEDLGSQLMNPAVLGTMALLFLPVEGAQANQYGILAGKTASLIHPTVMAALFGTSLYSGYLGLQWRRLRGLSEEIKDLQKQGPILSTGPAKFPIADSITDLNTKIASMSTETDGDAIAVLKKDIDALNGASSIDSQITDLQTLRKKLQGAKLKDKHETTGSYLLGAGVTVAILGAFNTYMRAGKLFPGPHLYAGMAVTILWAVAASLTPAMQKGNANARSAHIALNSINVALFAWQVVSGIQITLKVWEKAPWP